MSRKMSWPFFYIKSPILRTIFMYDRERFSNFPPNQYHHRNDKILCHARRFNNH